MRRYFKFLNFSLILLIVSVVFTACNNRQTDKPYSISTNGNNLYVTMLHPVMENDSINWNGVFLTDVVEDMFQEMRNSSIKGGCHLYVRFENVSTDKYGNQSSRFDEKLIMTIPMSEVVKYTSSKYFNDNYKISEKITETAFPKLKTTENANNQTEEGDSIDYVTDPEKWESNEGSVQISNISEFMKRYREAQSKK